MRGRVPRFLAVLWDADGTLLDSRLSIRETLNTVLKEKGQPLFTKAELDALIGRPLREILALKCSDAALIETMTQRYRATYGEVGWVTARLFAGLQELLWELRAAGVRLGVVTSKGQQEMERLLGDLGLQALFDVVVGDDDVRPLKPAAEPVLEACRRLGVAPAQAAMVGDTLFDVKSGKAAGAAAIGVTWGMQDAATLRSAGADRVVETVAALRRLLLG